MEVGNEISNKIRSAIKAKLIDLDVYVDEELPDYIMVMVANKKSQHQMAEDLSLFLSSNTETFTTWLHSLLQKLQSITSDPSAPAHNRVEAAVEKVKAKEQSTAFESSSSKHKKHGEKQVTEENRSRKRPSDEGIEDRKTRKSDQEKKGRAEDDAQSKQAGRSVHALGDNPTGVVREPVNRSEPSLQRSTQLEKNGGVIPFPSEKTELAIANKPVTPETIEPKKNVAVSHDPELDDLTELLLTETDELTEELERETATVPAPPKKKEQLQEEGSKIQAVSITVSDEEAHSKPQRGATSIIISSDSSKDNSPPRLLRPKAVASPIRQTVRHSAVVRAVEPRPSELFTRKRRAPTSVIGSVTHDSEEEDGYDPRNPAVGNVASVVKVTARKSSVPPKLQANKSLLLKAVSEAKESVESQRRVAVTPIRPFMRSEGRDKDRDRERERERERERDRSGRSSSHGSSRDSHPTARLAQAGLRQAINQSSNQHLPTDGSITVAKERDSKSGQPDPPVYIPTRKVQPAPRVDSSDRDKVGIISRSRRQEAQQRAWLEEDEEEATPARKFIKRGKNDPIVNFIIETEYENSAADSHLVPPVKVKEEPVSPQQSSVRAAEPSLAKESKQLGIAAEIDSRVVEYEPEVMASAAENVSESGSQGVPLLLEDMEQEEFVLDQDVLDVTESSSVLFEEDLRHALIHDKPKDKTRFVVTLDGVDTEQFEMEASASERVEMAMEEAQPVASSALGLAAAGVPSQLKEQTSASLITPPKMQPLNINLKDSDEEGEAMEMEPSPLAQAKVVERCKFWPACVNGSACAFHHPTVHCKTFPMCKFGDKCLYIHPNCRFDSKCARPDCPYTHTSRRSVPAFQAPLSVPIFRPPPPAPMRGMTPPQCKFFPECTNMSCPFYHPKPCRFGLGCKNKDQGCIFYHPRLPSVSKLTWVAGKDSGSGSLVLATGAAKEAKKII